MKLRHVLFCSSFLLACGGTEPSAEHAEGEHHAGGEHHHEHAAMPESVDRFHAVLAPIWHSEPGPSRSELACQNTEQLGTSSRAIADAPVPEGVEEATWRSATEQLIASIGTLGESCAASPQGSEEKLHEVHEHFHHLMEALPN